VTQLLSNKGGFSDTYEVQHQGKPKVLKVLRHQDPKIIELLKREFEVLSQSNHPGIPKGEAYFEFFPKDSSVPLHCLVMQKIVGVDLQEYIQRRGRPIDQQCALNWLEQLAHILEEIHNRNLLHRDIKPSNIILQPDGHLVLIDFGAVGRFDSTQSGSTASTRIYTPDYAAPEQERGMAEPRSDFFSLGRTFIYLLTGKEVRLLYNQVTNQLNWHPDAQHLSPQLVNCIDQLMSQDMGQRPANAQQLLQMIQALHPSVADTTYAPPAPATQASAGATVISVNQSQPAAETSVAAAAAAATAIPTKPNRRNLLLAGGALLLLGGGGGFGLWNSLQTTGSPNSVIAPSPQGGGQSVALCSEKKLVKKSGNLYGVIEVGSKGVKGAVIQELSSSNEEGFKFIGRSEKIEQRNVDPRKPSTQPETVKAVQDMFRELQSRFSIPCEQVLIYGSSGVGEKAPHKDKLLAAIEQGTGRSMAFISTDQEATLIFEGIVPEWRRNQVLSLDLGNGNSKGSFLQNSGQGEYSTFALLGSGTFKDEVDKIKQERGIATFTEAAAIAKKERLAPQIQAVLQSKAGLQNTPRIYLSGGIAWALSTLIRPCEPEQTIDKKEERVSRFSRLTAEDITTFYTNVTRDRTSLFQPNLSACDEERQKRVKKDIERIKFDVFKDEDLLIAGAELLRAFSEELKFAEKERIFFSQYAIDALPTGYLIQEVKRSSNQR
jgi:serine/threonine protein kinase